MMYTIIFILSKNRNKLFSLNLPPGPIYTDSNYRFQFFSDWRLLQTINDPCPFLIGLQSIGKQFAELVCNFSSNAFPILVLDSKLLPITSALKHRDPTREIITFIKNPLHAEIAQQLVSSDSLTCTTMHTFLQGLRNTRQTKKHKKKKFSAVWLGYENAQPLSSVKLQESHTWQFINDIFELHLFDECVGGVFGMLINYGSIGECWVDSAVDWVIHGVRRAASFHGYPSHAITVVHVTSFVLQCCRLAIIFRINMHMQEVLLQKEIVTTMTNTSCTSNIPAINNLHTNNDPFIFNNKKLENVTVSSPLILLSRWRTVSHWDIARSKRPLKSSVKFFHLSKYIVKLCQHFLLSNILLHEHGFHYVRKALVPLHCTHVVHYSNGDLVQQEELQRKGLEFVGEEELHDRVSHFNGMFFLSECGISQWRNKWLGMCDKWLHCIFSSSDFSTITTISPI